MSSSAGTERISVRELGQVRCSVVNGATLHWDLPERGNYSWRGPDVPTAPSGRADIGVNWLAITGPDTSIVVDPVTWAVPETIDDALAVYPGEPIDHALATLGLAPSEIRDVILTHWHLDHLTGLVDADGQPRFSQAVHHFPELDWRLLRDTADDSPLQQLIIRALWETRAAGHLSLIGRAGAQISPSVRIEWTGGESPGHQVVRVTGEDCEAMYLGDLIHFPNEVAHPAWVVADGRQEAELLDARQRLFSDAASQNAVVVFTHGRFPGWGMIKKRGSDYLWQYE